MKKISLISYILLLTILCNCTSKKNLTLNVKEDKIQSIQNSINEITFQKELNLIINSNEEKNIEFKIDTLEINFKVKYSKNKISTLEEFKIFIEEDKNIRSKNNFIIFAGFSGFIKKFLPNEILTENPFIEKSNIFASGRISSDYSVTDINSFPLYNTNYALFKVLDLSSNVKYYGIIKFNINTENIIFDKIIYSKTLFEKITE